MGVDSNVLDLTCHQTLVALVASTRANVLNERVTTSGFQTTLRTLRTLVPCSLLA